MSYDSKIAAARELIEQHNSNATNQVDFDKSIEKLRNMGGSSDDALRAVSWEDLERCGFPTIIARRLSHVFRQESDGTDTGSAYVSEKKARMLTAKELIERYNPTDVKNSVGERLRYLSDGKPFIIFDDSGKVMVDDSVKLLEDIMKGLPEIDTAFVCGRPYPVFKVGDRPETYADENPLYPGRLLRSGETCDQTGRSWCGIDNSIRQLLYLAIKQKELKIDSVASAGDIMDKVMSQDCYFDNLRSRYPKASKLYDELFKIGRLPLLKIKINIGNSSNNKSNNPFGASEPRIF